RRLIQSPFQVNSHAFRKDGHWHSFRVLWFVGDRRDRLLQKSALKITPEVVKIIRHEITTRSPVLMGANRKPLVANSVGETLAEKHGVSPQVMSYVLPLLIEEKFCTVSDRKPFMIHKK